MKVIKINKLLISGIKEHFLVLLDEPYSNDDINSIVEKWCESEPSGFYYGYTYNWEFVTNENIINRVLKDNICILEDKIKRLTLQKNKTELIYNNLTKK